MSNVAAGLLDNPLKYAHIVTSTTHKTLRGPRGGIIMMGKDFVCAEAAEKANPQAAVSIYLFI